jgi:membrane-bound lytic murein transglycosylase D
MKALCRYWWLGLMLCVVSIATTRAQESPFVKPASLAPAVEFWKRVYTEVTTSGGLIHDDTELNVVYRVLEFANGTSATVRNRRIDDEKNFVASTLRKLANGEEPDTDAERRVRAAWPEGTSRSQFREAIDHVRFQLGQADRFKEGLIRSGRWRDEIRHIFKSQGLPEQLAALPHVESSFNPYAYSKVGAAGMWQFMRSTGKRFLRIDNVVDERLDPYKASKAAAIFMQQNFSVVQSWPLAVTSYNHGAGGMRRAKEQLGTDDIGEIVQRYDSKSFGFASRNFYACFLAALEIDSEPKRYFPDIEIEAPDASKVLPVKRYTSMPALMRELKLGTTDLKLLNPSLMASVWKGSKRIPEGFELRVPGEERTAVASAIASLPAAAVAETQVVDTRHRVRKGETLAGIANKYGVSTAQLARMNGLRQPYRLSVGKVLALPAAEGAPTTTTVATAVPATPAAADLTQEFRHVIKRGDTLNKIAQRYSVAMSELVALNQLRNANDIRLGQSLVIRPAGGDVANASEPDETPLTPDVQARVEKVEPKTESEAEALGPTLLPGVEAAATADPSDYAVRKGDVIRVEVSETLGHYAEWLGLSAATLRKLNKLPAGASVRLGQQLKMSFARVSKARFETQRTAFHQQMQDSYFAAYRIVGTAAHVFKKGESVWELSQKTYSVPVWLLRQYNPDLDLTDVKPGTKLIVPKVEAISG